MACGDFNRGGQLFIKALGRYWKVSENLVSGEEMSSLTGASCDGASGRC